MLGLFGELRAPIHHVSYTFEAQVIKILFSPLMLYILCDDSWAPYPNDNAQSTQYITIEITSFALFSSSSSTNQNSVCAFIVTFPKLSPSRGTCCRRLRRRPVHAWNPPPTRGTRLWRRRLWLKGRFWVNSILTLKCPSEWIEKVFQNFFIRESCINFFD